MLSSSIRSEHGPRSISQPSHSPDKASQDAPKGASRAGGLIHPHGNAKPGEPAFLQRRPSKSREPPRKAGHAHMKPWSTCPAPGKKENPHLGNVFHRTWITDCGLPGRPLASASIEFASDSAKLKSVYGARPYDAAAARRQQDVPRRWSSAQKKEHYDQCEADLNSLKCSDEMFAFGGNAKMWTHLLNHGVTSGGQSEKLDVNPLRKSGLHLKSGLYKGKFENVQHKQAILRTRRKHLGNPFAEDRQLDNRMAFDCRLKDDIINFSAEVDKEMVQGSFELHRPSHTRSCPQMGAEWMHR